MIDPTKLRKASEGDLVIILEKGRCPDPPEFGILLSYTTVNVTRQGETRLANVMIEGEIRQYDVTRRSERSVAAVSRVRDCEG